MNMNVFDYFFESSQHLEKDFLLGSKETISFKNLYKQSLKVATFLNRYVGAHKNILIISPNSGFFITAYLSNSKLLDKS